MKVRIIPKCQRAKSRIHEHGETMEFIREFKSGEFLVKSLNKTFLNKTYWLGWFSKEEATYEVLIGEKQISNG